LNKKQKDSIAISVVIPVYNDEEVLSELFRRLQPVLKDNYSNYEIVFVDDGSKDSSIKVLLELQKRNECIKIIKLARNFGQLNAITAGLDNTECEFIVIMDSDLQDKPEDIPKLIDAMIEEDLPMAVARWISRKDGFIKRKVSQLFQYVTNKITNIYVAPHLGIFRALKRQVLQDLMNCSEKTASSISLIYWMGFDYAIVDLNRDPRYAGKSGYTLSKMFKMAFDRIFSYSLFPIQLANFIGAFLGISSLILAIYFVVKKFLFNDIVPGWTSLIVIVLFMFAINFLFFGVVGEYLGRIFLETKQRPRYIIEKVFKGDKLK